MHFIDPISQPEAPPPPLPEVSAPVGANDRNAAVVDLVDVLLLVVVSFGALFICSLVASSIFLIAHSAQGLSTKDLGKALEHNAFFLVPTQLASYSIVIGFMAFLVWARHRISLGVAIRWNFPKLGQALYALGGGACLALFSDAAELLLQRWIPKSLPITDYFRDRPSALLLAGFGILVAPLVEEIMFRGFLYPALARWAGSVPAVVLTGVGFALLHGAQLGFAWVPLLLIFIVGVVLTTARAVTASVATCVLMHTAYNFVLFGQTYIATHGFRQL